MLNLDIRKIQLRVEEIESAVESIRQYSSIPEDDFWEDRRDILSVEQLLLRAIEAVGGICLHIAAKKTQKGAENIAHCFEILRDNNLINETFCEDLIQMARFRNLLIHQYRKIDERKIYEYVKSNLGDFEKFIASVRQIAVFNHGSFTNTKLQNRSVSAIKAHGMPSAVFIFAFLKQM